MSQRQVLKAHARLFPHPNAEKLELMKVGPFQLVVQRGLYPQGETVLVAPEKALLPPPLARHYVNADTGVSYLHGPEKNRVGTVRLRGEISQGVVIPNTGYEHLPFDQDLSSFLEITFYEPPIPSHLAGEVESLSSRSTALYTQHDVEQFGIYQDEFVSGEMVLLTEKLHGSQGVFYRNPAGEWLVSSKGLSGRGLALKDAPQNAYWQAARNTGLLEHLDALFPALELQVFGEVIPIQKGFSYGQQKPVVKLFKVVLEGQIQPYDALPEWVRANWVPILYRGPFALEAVLPHREGKETVSGQGLHIREGVVLTPLEPRFSADGRDLAVKLISSAYARRETGEELS